MKRRTILEKDILEKANHFFLHTSDEMKKERRVLFNFVSDILIERNKYRGFSFLSREEMKRSEYGKSYGIDNNNENRFENTDQTRVFLF